MLFMTFLANHQQLLSGSNRLFANLGSIIYKTEQTEMHIQIPSLEEGTNLTKDFIIYKDEELIKRAFDEKCYGLGSK